MAASQEDVVNQTREIILQAIVAIAKAYKESPYPLYGHGYVFDMAARRLNEKWKRHESVDFIKV